MRVQIIDRKGREISVSRRDARLLVAIGKATLKPTVAPTPVAAILSPAPVVLPVEVQALPVDAPRETSAAQEAVEAVLAETKVPEPEPVAAEPDTPAAEPETELPTDEPVERVKRAYKKRNLTADDPAGTYKTRDMVAGK